MWRIHFKRLQARGSGGRKLKLEAFAIVPVSGDETLNQGSAGKAGGADFLLSPSSIECISSFPFVCPSAYSHSSLPSFQKS